MPRFLFCNEKKQRKRDGGLILAPRPPNLYFFQKHIKALFEE